MAQRGHLLEIRLDRRPAGQKITNQDERIGRQATTCAPRSGCAHCALTCDVAVLAVNRNHERPDRWCVLIHPQEMLRMWCRAYGRLSVSTVLCAAFQPDRSHVDADWKPCMACSCRGVRACVRARVRACVGVWVRVVCACMCVCVRVCVRVYVFCVRSCRGVGEGRRLTDPPA